jgi:hypothetical protein
MRLIEIGGNTANCKDLIQSFGFDVNEIAGRTVKIKLLNVGEGANNYNYSYVNYVIPQDLNKIWQTR